jgi:transcriptional regulator with XRE-family HTH domain
MLANGVNTVYTAGMVEKHEDAAMTRVRDWFEASGMTLHDLGMKMGYPEESARQSAWQFMKSGDPRISMLRRFAVASGLPLEELIGVPKAQDKKKKDRRIDGGADATARSRNDG